MGKWEEFGVLFHELFVYFLICWAWGWPKKALKSPWNHGNRVNRVARQWESHEKGTRHFLEFGIFQYLGRESQHLLEQLPHQEIFRLQCTHWGISLSYCSPQHTLKLGNEIIPHKFPGLSVLNSRRTKCLNVQSGDGSAHDECNYEILIPQAAWQNILNAAL